MCINYRWQCWELCECPEDFEGNPVPNPPQWQFRYDSLWNLLELILIMSNLIKCNKISSCIIPLINTNIVIWGWTKFPSLLLTINLFTFTINLLYVFFLFIIVLYTEISKHLLRNIFLNTQKFISNMSLFGLISYGLVPK